MKKYRLFFCVNFRILLKFNDYYDKIKIIIDRRYFKYGLWKKVKRNNGR